jgi:hypothetical protein
MNLSDLFGTGASITSGTLSIPLSALATAHGFDGSLSSITPSQILALIILQAKATTSEFTADPSYGVTVETGFDSLVNRGAESQISKGFNISFYSPNPNANFDPDTVI